MALTDTAIRSAKPKVNPYKLADEKGLFLLVTPDGGKCWRFDYRFEGKLKTVCAWGVYPGTSLRNARTMRDGARKLLARGLDPYQASGKLCLPEDWG